MKRMGNLPGLAQQQLDLFGDDRARTIVDTPAWVDDRSRRDADDCEFPRPTLKQLTAVESAQMTPSRSSAAISAADNPSQSP
jgi:hypothetical protein